MLSLFCTLQIMSGDACARVKDRLRREEGASTVEWVIITGFLIVLAGIVGTLIYDKVSEAGNKLEIPTAP